MIFYIADTHFGYLPILYATARPFSSVEEMDSVLISNWNKTVSDDDTVYIVGDFSYNVGRIPSEYLEQLKGRKHLIRGNHDASLDHQEDFYEYCESVTDYTEINDGPNHIILCHYPIVHNKSSYMIHGHVHNRIGQGYAILKTLPNVLNAGVDINFFKPVTLDELIKNNELFYSDRHDEFFPNPNEIQKNEDPSIKELIISWRSEHFRPVKSKIPDFRPLPEKPTINGEN